MSMNGKNSTKTKNLVLTAVVTAVICVIAPISIPIGTIPVSLQIFAIYLALYVLDWKRGTLAFVLYVVIGCLGIPVFAGFTSSGIASIVGPAGGYIVGFLPLSIICGIVFDKFPIDKAEGKGQKIARYAINFAAMIVGVAVCYAVGTAWFCYKASYSVGAALAVCVIPFIPFDIAKSICAMAIGPQIRKALDKAKLRNL